MAGHGRECHTCDRWDFQKVKQLRCQFYKNGARLQSRSHAQHPFDAPLTTSQWFTAFPQIVSRVGHKNDEVYGVLSTLITTVLQQYPKQALWLFTSVVKSTKRHREQRGRQILDQLRVCVSSLVSQLFERWRAAQNNPGNAKTQVPSLISQTLSMTNELLALCDYHIDEEKKSLSMKRDFPRLMDLGRSSLIIPLQESLTASLPPTSSSSSSVSHEPFPSNSPTFESKSALCCQFTYFYIDCVRRFFWWNWYHAFFGQAAQNYYSGKQWPNLHIFGQAQGRLTQRRSADGFQCHYQ